MSDQITFLDALVEAIRRAGRYNKNDQVPPVVVLWTDKDRQWEPVLPLLRERLPLLTLGQYNPAELTGPAYWLRCVIARTLPETQLPEGETPVIYLPDISKQELRAVEETPKLLQPLAELQYLGVLWNHKNGRDWTVAGFMQSTDGLGIEVGTDNATKEALLRALLKLADEPITRLKKDAPLRAPFFDALLNPDEVRSLLLWLNDAEGYPKRCSTAEWASFCGLSQRKYGFHPEKDGVMVAIALLGEHQDAWENVWNRYKEAPQAYPHLPELLRQVRPQQLPLFTLSESWPQDNETAEHMLREQLTGLRDLAPHEVRATIQDLELEHAPRRAWVWAKLGWSPLAMALRYLTALAQETQRSLGGATLEEISKAYTEWGWKADAAVIDALAAVEQSEDVVAMKAVIIALYRPWLEQGATAMQKLVNVDHASKTYQVEPLPEATNGTCILFCDGLRYDIGHRLIEALEAHKLTGKVTPHFAALPTVTPTAKPAISPVAPMLTGKGSQGLEPVVSSSGSKVTADVLRKLLAQAGYQVLMGDDLGDPSGKAWTEMGAIDSHGHQFGCRLVHHLASEIRDLVRRIESLISWGWKQVLVVTDHGWLLLPGDLPKTNLPEHLTVLRKGRCARLKDGSNTDQQTVPWYWDNETSIALAPGISCYEAGKEYEHGGLSPQECIVPVITVTQPSSAKSQTISIEKVSWRGLRCTITVNGASPDMKVDIRTKAGDATTSLTKTKYPNPDGTVSLLVEDEDRMGEAALIVLLDSDGKPIKHMATTIGG
jgi:hypothetical protein